MTAYHHSVSNRLLLDFRNGSLHFVVCNKAYQPLISGVFELIDEAILDDLLKDNPLFNNIYASVQLISSSDPFTLIPADIESKDEQKKLFQLNHKLTEEDSLYSSLLHQDILILHRLPTYLHDAILQKFPVCECSHAGSWLHTFVLSDGKSSGSHVYFQPDADQLKILVIKEGKTILLNQLFTTSDDEIFFEVMAVIEQLELDVEELTLHPAGLTSDDIPVITQFRNYIRNMNPVILKPINCNGQLLTNGLSTRMACA